MVMNLHLMYRWRAGPRKVVSLAIAPNFHTRQRLVRHEVGISVVHERST